MFRGNTWFKCDDCGEKFQAPDIEYGATVLSVPMPCPKCGSVHTMPISAFWFKKAYRNIWKDRDERKKIE